MKKRDRKMGEMMKIQKRDREDKERSRREVENVKERGWRKYEEGGEYSKDETWERT